MWCCAQPCFVIFTAYVLVSNDSIEAAVVACPHLAVYHNLHLYRSNPGRGALQCCLQHSLSLAPGHELSVPCNMMHKLLHRLYQRRCGQDGVLDLIQLWRWILASISRKWQALTSIAGTLDPIGNKSHQVDVHERRRLEVYQLQQLRLQQPQWLQGSAGQMHVPHRAPAMLTLTQHDACIGALALCTFTAPTKLSICVRLAGVPCSSRCCSTCNRALTSI